MGQTIFPSASIYPSASIPPAWGQVALQAYSASLNNMRQSFLPASSMEAIPSGENWMDWMLSASLCQVCFFFVIHFCFVTFLPLKHKDTKGHKVRFNIFQYP